MASIWEAPKDMRELFERVRHDHHQPRLAQASIWVLVTDAPGVRGDQVITTTVHKCSAAEKLASGHDFRIVVRSETWANLADPQRLIAADEALCQCGVKYVPQTVEVNGKKEILKDEWGRVLYTDQISYDEQGVPRWKLNKPDAALFYVLLGRHGEYCEAAENVTRALDRRPLLGTVDQNGLWGEQSEVAQQHEEEAA